MCCSPQPGLISLTLLYLLLVTAVMEGSVLTEASDGVAVNVGWYLESWTLGLALLMVKESESLKAGHRTPRSQTPVYHESGTVQGLQMQLRRQGHYTSHGQRERKN